MMAEKLGISEADLRRLAPITVMTKGEAGALITVGNDEFEIPPAKPRAVLDPTGAGDAFRAGFILGMTQGLPWPTSAGWLPSPGFTRSSTKGPSSTPTRSRNSWRATRKTSDRLPRSRCRPAGRRTPDTRPSVFDLPKRSPRAILSLHATWRFWQDHSPATVL